MTHRDVLKFVPRKYVKHVQYVYKGVFSPLVFRENKNSVKVFANSFPKAGTNLLENFFRQISNFNNNLIYHVDPSIESGLLKSLLKMQLRGQVITSHMFYSEGLSDILNENQIKSIFIIRDLRDIAVSNFHYITYKDRYHRLHKYYNSIGSDEERLNVAIGGINVETGLTDKTESIGEFANHYIGWLRDRSCLVVKFEDLIGDHGGGSDTLRDRTIDGIFDFLSISVNKNEYQKLKKNLFNTHSKTFRKGKIGDWKNHFTKKNKALFKSVAGETLIELGYEKDLNW